MKPIYRLIKRSIYIEGRNLDASKYVIKHLKDFCVGESFSFQIIEVFSGTGYKKNKACPVNCKNRLRREDYWIKTLRMSKESLLNFY